MEICFSDVQVRDLCCSRKALVSKFGTELAKMICCRLSMLKAAPTLDDVPIAPPISLSPLDGKGRFSMNLGKGYRLLLQAEAPKAVKANKTSKINDILIIGIEKPPTAKGRKQ